MCYLYNMISFVRQTRRNKKEKKKKKINNPRVLINNFVFVLCTYHKISQMQE